MNFKIVAVVLVVLAVAPSCAREEAREEASPTRPLPVWIEHVQPEPGQQVSAARVVEVRHRVSAESELVRLELDGVDVTSFARLAPGVIHYDSMESTAPVRLEPGRHSAIVEHVRLTEEGTQQVLDSFTWSFEIL
ncbi:MAG: hypothetical protein KY429_07195 [Actinobacteria bacterium]|nr:hypothetical protein [Actinomycetota bacterium]